MQLDSNQVISSNAYVLKYLPVILPVSVVHESGDSV